MGESLPTHHEDHIAGKGDNSLQHCHLVHKFVPMPQAMKIPAAKAAVDKEWEKLEKISVWNLTKVRSEKEVIDEHTNSRVRSNSSAYKQEHAYTEPIPIASPDKYNGINEGAANVQKPTVKPRVNDSAGTKVWS